MMLWAFAVHSEARDLADTAGAHALQSEPHLMPRNDCILVVRHLPPQIPRGIEGNIWPYAQLRGNVQDPRVAVQICQACREYPFLDEHL